MTIELCLTPGDPDSVLEERSDIFCRCCGSILYTCDIKPMSGSQLRPYDSIEVTQVTEGSNVNCIVNHLSKVRIFCTTPCSSPTSAIVCHGDCDGGRSFLASLRKRRSNG